MKLIEKLRDDFTRSKYGSVSNIITEMQTLCSQAADEIERLQKVKIRYEYMRKLNVPDFQKIYIHNITDNVRFDDYIDYLIESGK